MPIVLAQTAGINRVTFREALEAFAEGQTVWVCVQPDILSSECKWEKVVAPPENTDRLYAVQENTPTRVV